MSRRQSQDLTIKWEASLHRPCHTLYVCTSRHLTDINSAFQFVFLPTRLGFYIMVLCFDLIFISLNRQRPKDLQHQRCWKVVFVWFYLLFSFPSNYAWSIEAWRLRENISKSMESKVLVVFSPLLLVSLL